MTRIIEVGSDYSQKIQIPLITSDINAYQIIWNVGIDEGIFKITAKKANDETVFDFGNIENGTASYIMSNDMYNVEGWLTLYLALTDKDSTTTFKQLIFKVEKGSDDEEFAKNNENAITSLTKLIFETADLKVDKADGKDLSTNDYTDGDKETVNLSSRFLKYGYKDVYVLKEGVDILVDENGELTKVLQTPDYDVIAVPDSVKKINITPFIGEYSDPVLNWMKTLILSESVESLCGKSVGDDFNYNFVNLLVVLNPKCVFEMDNLISELGVFCAPSHMTIKAYTNSTAHKYVNKFNKLYSENNLLNATNNYITPKGGNVFSFIPLDVENAQYRKNICYMCGTEPLYLNHLYDILSCDHIYCLLPRTATVGDWVRIDFVSSDTPTNLSIYAMTGMSDVDLIPEANTSYTLYFDYGKLDENEYGWRFSYNEYKKVEE